MTENWHKDIFCSLDGETPKTYLTEKLKNHVSQTALTVRSKVDRMSDGHYIVDYLRVH